MRRALFGILPLIVAGLLACQDDAAKLDEHMERGRAYAEEGSLREAIIEFKSALQIDPNLADAHYQLAHAYLRSRKAKEGYWELRETVRLDPSNLEAKLEFSQIAIVAGEAEEALVQSTSVVEAAPDDVRGHLMQAQALSVLGRNDEALEAYRLAAKVAPEDQTALRALSHVEGRAGNDEAATAAFDKLIELYPTFENYSSLANFLRGKGPKKREEALRKALEVAEGDERPRAYAQLTSYLVSQDRTDEAFAMLDEASRTEEEPVDIIYLLARLHRSVGNADRADELIEEAAVRRPDDPRVHLVLAAYRVRQEDLDAALESVNKAVELDPEDRRAKLQKAEILMELGFREGRDGAADQARGILEEVLAEDASNPEALLADAKFKLGSQDLEGAEQQLRAALGGRPNWAQAYYLLGLTKAAQEDFPAARVELARSLELDSSILDAKAVLAQVHYQLGEWDYAVERAREYLRERPDNKQLRLILAQSLVRMGRIDEADRELASIPDEMRTGEVLYALGRIQQARGNLEAARRYLEEANDQLPNNWDILQAMLMLDRTEGRLEDSKQRVAQALEAEPENARLHQLNAIIAYNEERLDDAEAGFRKAIELDPQDLSAYERLARMYAQTGRLEQTAQTYEQALEVRPEESSFHHFLGVLYELSGDKQRAMERYEDAIRYGPNHAEAKNNLAYLYADSGQKLDRALDLAQDAKALLPDNPSVADTLGWVLYKRGVPSAAISYLKEAEAATSPQDASLGVVRFHLAQAYEANGEPDQALAALERSLEVLESQRKAAEAAGKKVGPEPAWAAEARALRERLAAAQTASGG